MNDLVTIGLPIYKRLQFLPNVLRSVSEQDYPAIELIISDNGVNGSKVPEIVRRYYSGSFKFRQNPSTATISTHFNQIIQQASGKYFMILSDDDEISPNFLSEMVALFERYPQASVGLSKQEIMDESGRVIRTSSVTLPPIVRGPDFIKGLWRTSEYKFEGLVSFFSRTDDLKACGGYPEIHQGHGHDDALVVKLCLENYVAMSSQCAFRFRVYDTSHGLSIRIEDAAQGTKEFLRFVRFDPTLRHFAAEQPAGWRELKEIIESMSWRCYFERWQGLYRKRLRTFHWVKAAFALPFIPAYYRAVSQTLLSGAAHYLSKRLRTVRTGLRY